VFRLRYGLAGAIAVMALAGAVNAQTFDGAEIIHAAGMADLQQFALQHGDAVLETGKIGDIRVVAKAKNGFTYSLIGVDCRHPGTVGCQDLLIEVRYVATPKVTDATLAAANRAFAALKVWEDAGGKVVGISRYIVLRDGVTRRNVLDNVDLLARLAPAAARVAFGKPLPVAAKAKR
jgi:hypothetical protein